MSNFISWFSSLYALSYSCVNLKDLKPREGLGLIEEDEEEEEEMQTIVVEEPTEKWDCESILSKFVYLLVKPLPLDGC